MDAAPTYDLPTQLEFTEMLTKLANLKALEKRTWMVFTGEDGKQRISELMKQQIVMLLNDTALKNGLVSEDQYLNLKSMIQSPDKENMIVAEEILKQLETVCR